MSDELKPVRCGCGGEAVVGSTTSCLCYVECQKCLTETRFFRTEAEAVTAWNRAMSGNVQECAKDARCTERKKGKWEVQPSTGEDRLFIWWKCSECGHVIFSETERDRREFHAFCGRCGADMRGEE